MIINSPIISGSLTTSGSMYVNSPNTTMGQFVGNQNGYVEFSVKNISTGVSASGDIAVYADDGTATSYYIDMGINNSNAAAYAYDGAVLGKAHDAYVFNTGGNLIVGNANNETISQSLYLFANPSGISDLTITGSNVGIGRNFLLPKYTLDVSGSVNVNNNLTVSGSLTIATGTNNLTASWANNAITASYAVNTTTASYAANSTTASYAVNSTTASYAVNSTTASYAVNATTASYAVNATTSATASFANTFTVANTLTAQTLVVQTITSSIDYVTGSTRFGSSTANTHTFTGSMNVSGSVTAAGGLILNASQAITTGGAIGFNSAQGVFVYGKTGTSYDFKLYNGVGSTVVQVPTGTQNVEFLGTASFAGNVGINKTTPTVALDVLGSGVSPVLLQLVSANPNCDITLQSSNSTSLVRLRNGSDDFQVHTSGSQRMTVTSAGLVGIGTTNPLLPFVVSNGTNCLEFTANYSGNQSYLQSINRSTSAYTPMTYYASTQTLYSGANRVMDITGSFVGIGTSSPTDPLVVQTGVNAQRNVTFKNTDTTDSNTRQGLYLTAGTNTLSFLTIHGSGNGNYIQGTANQPLYFQQTAGGTINMTITSTGNVGIGVTPTSWDATYFKPLEIGNSNSRTFIYGRTDTTIESGIGSNAYYSTAGWKYTNNGGASFILLGDNEILFRNTGTGTSGNSLTWNTSMKITNTNGLQLNTAGAAIFDMGASNSYARISSGGGGVNFYMNGATRGGTTTAASNTAVLALDGDFYITNSAVNSTKMIILSTGQVGIGTSSPQRTFVVARSNGQGIEFDNQTGYATILSYNRTTSTYTPLTMGEGTTNVGIGTTTPGSKLEVNGTITESSSIRYKENVETIKYGLDEILKMRGVSYTKKDTQSHEIGVIAEEVNEFIPEVVIKSEEGEVESVAYGRLTAVLIEAVKELQAQINELKNK